MKKQKRGIREVYTNDDEKLLDIAFVILIVFMIFIGIFIGNEIGAYIDRLG